MVFPVVRLAGGRKAQDVAIPQFDADAPGDVRKVGRVGDKEAAAGGFRDMASSSGPPASSCVLPPPNTPMA